jgi:hypothetical protein
MKKIAQILSKTTFIILVFAAFVAILKYLHIEIALINDILDVYLPKLINA